MSGWIKRLKKRLRRRRSALLLASIALVALLFGTLLTFKGQSYHLVNHRFEFEDAQAVLAAPKWQVTIQNHYFVGPITEETLELTTEELEQWLIDNPHVEKVAEEDYYVVFKQMITDLSPIIKEQGYFALDEQGVLHLYQGETKEENIIQTFFQVDIDRLETSLPVEEYMHLRKGIHITSLAEYNQVLSMYSEFAVLMQDEEETLEQ